MRRCPAGAGTRPILWLAGVVLTGCASAPYAAALRGKTQPSPIAVSEIAQSDVNCMATLGMRDNIDSLLRVADKLYRRNPPEWRKGAADREAALARLRRAIDALTP